MAGDEARCCPAFGARGAVATAAERHPPWPTSSRWRLGRVERPRQPSRHATSPGGREEAELQLSARAHYHGVLRPRRGPDSSGSAPRGPSRDDGPRRVRSGRDDLPRSRKKVVAA